MASSKRIQFFKGTKVKYDELINDRNKESIIKNGIYFCTDRKTIMTQGLEYGGFDTTIFDGVVMNLKVENGVLTYDTVVKGQPQNKTTNLTLVTNNDNSINVVHKDDGGVDVSVKVKKVNADEDGIKLDTGGLYVDLTNTDAKIVAERNARTTAIQGMSLASTGGTGKYITTIAQENGKVTATADDLTSVNVKRTATSNVDGQVDMTGTTVENALVDLAKAVDSTKKAAATYSIEKVTTGLGANVKEAYQLVQTVDGKKTYVDVQIPIYKDRSLKSVELTETDNKGAKGQFMKYTYNLDDKTAEEVYVNVSKLLHESEFKNGLQVSDSGEVSIKLDANNENEFLTVSDGGVKLSGVQAAIKNAKDTLQDGINSVQQKANDNATAIERLNTDVAKANNIVVNGGTNIAVELTNDPDEPKIFKVSNTASNTDSKVANQYVTLVSQSNGAITVGRAQPDATEIKYTKTTKSSIVGKTVHEALEEIDQDLQWIDAGTYN